MLLIRALSTQDHEKYVAKNIFHTEFEYHFDLQRPLANCPNLRTVVDTVPDHLLFLYPYLTDVLLEVAKKESLSDGARKRVLRDALAGLANLHNQNIFHSCKQHTLSSLHQTRLTRTFRQTSNPTTSSWTLKRLLEALLRSKQCS